VLLDVTDERALRALDISDVDVAIVAIGDNRENSIMAVAMLRKLGVGRVIARATDPLHEHVLAEIGASETIKVEEEMGEIIASKIIAPHVLQRYNFAAGYSIVELKIGKKYAGKTLVESKIRQNYNLSIVALQKRLPFITEDGKASYRIEINDCPMPMDVIDQDDVIVLVGSEKNFNKFCLNSNWYYDCVSFFWSKRSSFRRRSVAEDKPSCSSGSGNSTISWPEERRRNIPYSAD